MTDGVTIWHSNWEDAHAKVWTEHGFARGGACLCSFNSKERGVRVVLHGDDFLSEGATSQPEWLEKCFDAEHSNFMEKFGDQV